jgi:hypothetical protein
MTTGYAAKLAVSAGPGKGMISYIPFATFEEAMACAESCGPLLVWAEICEINPPSGRRYRSICRLGRDDLWAMGPYELPRELEEAS